MATVPTLSRRHSSADRALRTALLKGALSDARDALALGANPNVMMDIQTTNGLGDVVLREATALHFLLSQRGMKQPPTVAVTVALMDLLLTHGARPTDLLWPKVPLMSAALMTREVAIVECLLHHGVPLHQCEAMAPAMHHLVVKGSAHERAAVQALGARLLLEGADLEAADRKGHTALAVALKQFQVGSACALLDLGASALPGPATDTWPLEHLLACERLKPPYGVAASMVLERLLPAMHAHWLHAPERRAAIHTVLQRSYDGLRDRVMHGDLFGEGRKDVERTPEGYPAGWMQVLTHFERVFAAQAMHAELPEAVPSPSSVRARL